MEITKLDNYLKKNNNPVPAFVRAAIMQGKSRKSGICCLC